MAALSEIKQYGHSAVTLNNKIYVSGGVTWPASRPGNNYASNTIDIYDNATNSWSKASMMEGKFNHASIAVGDKIYWCGGLTGNYQNYNYSCSVEIMNVNTGANSIQNLFAPGQWWIEQGQNAVVKDNKIILIGPHANEIYDIATNTWYVGILPLNVSEVSIISVNNTIYVAGGYVNSVISNQVWKLEF